MKKILEYIKHNRSTSRRVLLLFLVLIYIPMALNIYIVYNQTIDAVEREKVEVAEEVMRKTRQTINLTLGGIEEGIYKIVSQNGIRKGLEDYEKIPSFFQEKISKFLIEKLVDMKEMNSLIDQFICITTNGRVFIHGGELNLGSNEFFDSDLYKAFSQNNDSKAWFYIDSKDIFTNYNNDKLIILGNKIYSIINEKRVVAYLLTVIDTDNFKALHQDIALETTGKINIYDDRKNIVFSEGDCPGHSERHNMILANKTFNILQRTKIEDEEYFLGIAPLIPKGWYMETIIPSKELTDSIKESLKKSLFSIMIITFVLSIWIIIEIIIFSKVATENEMAKYRLVLSEKMNEKLRMYKHDMMNHLQIVRGLIEMEYTEKAIEHIKSIANEGMLIKDKYEIGIPEIESTIYTATSRAREKNIDIEIECIKLPNKLNVKIYDLTKILSNLIKNAIDALESTEGKEKKLKIKIYEDFEDYVFEIINNIPIIHENLRDKIFKKGYTTKGNKGSGLGLYIVKKIVSKNNGELELTVDEQGNHFIVRFPQNP